MKMRKARAPGALSLKLASLEVGDREVITGATRARVLSTIQGRAGLINTQHPERRFELGTLGPMRVLVRRLPDLPVPAWEKVWAGVKEIDTKSPTMARSSFTYVPASHAFAVWAGGLGLGVVIEGWWAWEHAKGWITQRDTQALLRRWGVPARTWTAQSKTGD